jgi:predicted metal-binding membrane protein
VSGGCWDFASFLFVVRVSRLFIIIIIIIIIIICRRLRAGSREIISFLVFEILSVCRRRAFDDATMRHRTLFGRRF